MKTALPLAMGCLTALSAVAYAQRSVDFEMMTWPEIKKAIEQGKTTALVYNGGTEQRGPQNVNGGHTLMGHATVLAIAEKLGNAIAAPVLPFSVNNASAACPGDRPDGSAVRAINEQVAEQLLKSGFKNVVSWGITAAGKRTWRSREKAGREVRRARQRVVYCDEVTQGQRRFR